MKPSDAAVSNLMHLLALATAVVMMAIPSVSFSNILIHNNKLHDVSQQQTPFRLEMISSATNNNNNDELVQKFSSLRSIGVDYGLTRTGIAITTGGYRPRPLTILAGLNTKELSNEIVNYLLAEQATNIVLGLPLHKNGTASEQSSITRSFGQLLLQEVRQRCGSNIDIMLWDERYTSKEALARITAEAMARNHRIPSKSELSGEIDADAACIILEDFYKELGEDSECIMFENALVAEECGDIYRANMERQESLRVEQMEGRKRGRNARREMMERVRAEEEENGTADVTDGKKKKKKKKKKKR
mmetsp:Transcript_8631/g.19385  ORF Transcript_8631/g.19385 Transcript_8631/m.19385 type:complete len:303 (-) Transcript_8631:258-1166(-)|eukprot:CAMPEP_0172318324 /NCGR_PEP_ID=MMETSP1058-20130122/34574_1 /TAXON_ID=83371 /ORGANISM="Detonula confervacea, Strain CCMP 353" /LENGTH=302 /DNA_ID=CAMNT_0013033135 /DNA_START=44 /DNA_END=952 /DNA_ORIENTATION=+